MPVEPAELPPRRTEAVDVAEKVLAVLAAGYEAATENASWATMDAARGRARTVQRGIQQLGAADVHTTVRQGQDGRWRWYAHR
jgi:hypothetical protein